MQLILRNFITILKRFKTASILNVLGLSTAFAAFLIILMQVRYEQSFDKFHSKAERIYRLEAQDEEAGRTLYACILSRPQIEEFAASSPHIAAGALTENQNEVYLTVEQGDHPTGMREQMVLCTRSWRKFSILPCSKEIPPPCALRIRSSFPKAWPAGCSATDRPMERKLLTDRSA